MSASLPSAAGADVTREEPLLVLEPGRADKNYWLDLWRYRELFLILAWRDVSVRYKQTVVGVAWAVLRPLLTMAVFTVVFARVAGLPSDAGVPYALMVFAALLPWSLFSTTLSDASASLVNNANLISKVYFPRLIAPVAAAMTAVTEFLISLAILAALMLHYRVAPGWPLLALPGLMLLAVLASLGPGLWLTALNVKYRDFRYVIPFVVQFGLYVSPVGFSSSVVPERWRLLYHVNPMAGVIDGFRWSLFGGSQPLYWPGIGLGLVVIGAFLWLGVSRFRRLEKSFADMI